MLNGKIDSVISTGQSVVVNMQGCHLRCKYCHNPEMQAVDGGIGLSVSELVSNILMLSPSEEGCVTLSGGEPLLQLDFICEVFKVLKEKGITTCIKTSGQYLGSKAESSEKITELLGFTDRIYCDVKFSDSEMYKEYTNGSIIKTIDFLNLCTNAGKDVIARQVIVPTLNDSEADMLSAARLLGSFVCITGVELLGYSDDCKVKYEAMGRKYELEGIETISEADLDKVRVIFDKFYNAKNFKRQSR